MKKLSILILLALLISACESTVPMDSTEDTWTDTDAEEEVLKELYEECEVYGLAIDNCLDELECWYRESIGEQNYCTKACTTDEDCDGGVCFGYTSDHKWCLRP